MITNSSKWLLKTGLVTMLLAATQVSRAFIAGPYTPDGFTLHLWHLDEAATPCIDSAAGGTNLISLLTSATLSNPGFAGFGTSLNTSAGGFGKGDVLAAGTTGTANVSITLADPTSGAFTFEALIQVGFNPAVSNNTTTSYQIMSGESGVNANRIFQWRIAPKGFLLQATPALVATNQPYMTFENVRAVSGNQATIYAPIPTNGPDAIVQGNWYHVAVTYNGQPSTPGNFIMYWTAMNATNTADDALTITSPTTSLSGLNPLSTVTTPFELGNQARNLNGNFVGSIDEVRISKVARGPSGMMFALASVALTPLPNQFVPVGTNLTLTSLGSGGVPIGYQWKLNGTNITSVLFPNMSGFNSNSLTISNITFAEAGTYTLVATNSSSSTNVSAVITVGTPVTGLIATGLDNNGGLLPGGSVDPHWTLVQSADTTFVGPNAIVPSIIATTYLPNGPNSQWIAPGDNVNVAGGNYEYQTSFVLDSQNLTNMQLVVNWAADNVCSDIILNGVDLAITDGNGFTGFAPTLITNNFIAGSNTLICVMSNSPGTGPNISAFRAELSALSAPQPPTAITILGTPANVTTNQFQNASFTVAAYGSGPLSYQWFFGATPLSGQTNRTLALSNLASSQSGSYTVVITNSISTNSATASLTVNATDTLEWLGLTGPDWDLTSTNWLDTNTVLNAAFFQTASVLFDNNGSGQASVSLDVPLNPNSVTVSANNTYTFGGAGFLTGNFNLFMKGPGTLIMDTANTYTGNTIISGGTLQVGNNDANGSLGTSSIVISNAATLNFTRTDVQTESGIISGPGAVTMAGTGTLLLAGNNAGFTGPTSVTGGGILTPRHPNALGNGSGTTTVADGSQVYIDQNLNFPSQSFILGGTGPLATGAIRKGGAGVTTLGGPITTTDFSALVLDGNSTLQLSNAAAVTSPNANFAVQGATGSICTFAGAVNLGAGSFTEFGTGTVIFSSVNNVWTGGTTINTGGIIQVGDGGTNGSIGNGSIANSGTLTYLTASNLTFTTPVSGAGVFSQSGTGRIILTNGPLSGFSGTVRNTGNGQLQLAPGESLTTASSLVIGGGQADTNRVELTGNNLITAPISIFPRAFINTLTATTPTVNYADIDNVSGTNTVNPATPVVIASGGNLFCLQSDSGYLIFGGGVLGNGVGRDFAIQGAGAGEIDGPLTQGTGFSLNVYMMGPGLWRINSTNLYTGVTAVSNGTLIVNGIIGSSPVTAAAGTLGGTGVLTGPVVIAAGATLAPTLASGVGTPIGAMTISNSLTLATGSITSLQINKGAASNDQFIGLSNVVVSGSLVVTNLSGTLAAGDSFKLFSASNYAGAFTSITPASPGAGLRWNLSSVGVDGTLRVISTNVTRPSITSVVNSGGNLGFSGSGGVAGSTFVLLTSTSVNAPLATWTPVSTNLFDGSGHFSLSAAVTTNGSRFFALQAK